MKKNTLSTPGTGGIEACVDSRQSLDSSQTTSMKQECLAVKPNQKIASFKKTISGHILLFSDLHLGIHQNSCNRLKISISIVEEMIKCIKNENISNIIFLGDYFHSRDSLSPLTLTVGYRLLETLSKQIDGDIFMIVGNHDLYTNSADGVNSVCSFSSIPKVTVIDKDFPFLWGKKRCLAVPWKTPETYPKENINENFDYIFTHSNIGLFPSLNGQNYQKCTDNYSKYLAALLPNGIFFSGHYHKRFSTLINGDKYIYSIGSPNELSFGETDCLHGWTVLNSSTGDVIFHESHAPKFQEIRLSTILDKQNGTPKPLSEKIKKTLKGNIIKPILDIPLDDLKKVQNIDKILIDNSVFEVLDSSLDLFFGCNNNINPDQINANLSPNDTKTNENETEESLSTDLSVFIKKAIMSETNQHTLEQIGLKDKNELFDYFMNNYYSSTTAHFPANEY